MSKLRFGVAVLNDSEDKIPARDHIQNIIKYARAQLVGTLYVLYELQYFLMRARIGVS